ncbi:MAG: hypothetical protein CVU89_00330 [Firmicutes bacterium HGW-Firmicutes-14]|nr:MAG: hypothetical protein CVU89_00330 [Firmicutes bacterium HGW-Firmicutes-14]
MLVEKGLGLRSRVISALYIERGNMTVISMVTIIIGMVIMLVMFSLFSVYIGKRHGDNAADAAALKAALVLQERYREELAAKKEEILDAFWDNEVYPLASDLVDENTGWDEAVMLALSALLDDGTAAQVFYNNRPPAYPDLKYVWKHARFKSNFSAEANGGLLVETCREYNDEIIEGAKEFANKNGVEDCGLYFPIGEKPVIGVETIQPLWFALYNEYIPAESRSIKGAAGARVTVKVADEELPIDVSDYERFQL